MPVIRNALENMTTETIRDWGTCMATSAVRTTSLSDVYILILIWSFMAYTRKNARSVTAFNSTDIRAEQDNVATPVTAMMATVCISTDIRHATELM